MAVRTRRLVVAALGVAMVVLGVPAEASAGLHHERDFRGNLWIVGCVETDVAARLVEHAGFSVGGGPVVGLCAIDEIWISRKL